MTTVQLFGDIGLYANYKQTVDFTSVSEQNTWFNNKTHTTINNVNYNKAYNSLKLNIDYGTALQYTYCRLIDLDSTSRIYYYFINNVNVIDENTVEFILEMDVFQTFMTYWKLNESMVNRAHVDRWGSGTDPIRITPNVEGIDCLYSVEEKTLLFNTYTEPEEGQDATTYAIMFAYVVFKADIGIKAYCSPFVIYPNKYSVMTPVAITNTDGGHSYVGAQKFVNNTILTDFNIDPESVICMFVSPFTPNAYTSESSTTYPGAEFVLKFYTSYVGGAEVKYIESSSTPTEIVFEVDFSSTYKLYPNQYDIDLIEPIKPTNDSNASDEYEPALYMQPYRSRVVTIPSASLYYELPDNAITKDGIITFVQLYGSSNQNVMILVGSEYDRSYDNAVEPVTDAYAEGLTNTYMMDTIDVFNNAWLTYALTQKDSDRQILNNNAISNIIQGLVFGSYGGALVTSRGTGGKDKRSLAQMGSRMIPGIALGGLASAGSAIIDSHFAWENQLLEERKIQNKAQQISINGTNGANNAIMGVSYPTFVVMKCDDVNYQRAYDNFRKYGYLINQFTTLNIRSRKYYNYVMTNGAVIGGSLPEDARSIIASAFDAGITIYHGDYCSSLEYPTYENIERSLI